MTTTLAAPPGLALRPYQREAIAAIVADWSSAITPAAVVLPTGAGKTVIFSALSNAWHDGFPGIVNVVDTFGRVVILVHRDELAGQAAAKARAMAPHLRVGIVKASTNEVMANIVVASVQTLRNPKRMAQLTDVGMIIVDECHHAFADSYKAILTYYGCYDDDMSQRTPCVGFTATLHRADRHGLGGIFEKVSYTKDLMWMIKNGYLCDVRGLSIEMSGIDLGKIRRSRGDYSEAELGEMMGQELVCKATADAYIEHAAGRRAALFAPTVDSADAMAVAFNDAGVPTEVVTGETPLHDPGNADHHAGPCVGRGVRCAIYHRFRLGETLVLASCMVLTEGWDAPWAEVAIIARPTQSASLYIQMAGRVLRLWPGKDKALILDVVGAAKTHKLASLIDMSVWTPLDGESLLEAEKRELSELDNDEREDVERTFRGPKYQQGGRLVEVNLFAQSASCWQRTDKGIWFVSTKLTTWFLWPEPGDTFAIATYENKNYGARPTLTDKTGLPMDLAISLAESAAMYADPSIASKSSSWRTRNSEASQAQRDAMLKWRIPYPEAGLTKAEAGDLLSVASASARIDRYVR